MMLALILSLCLSADIHGRVVSITDGDTLTVLDAQKVQHKIRLNGIDAPESNQPFGTKSREALAELTFCKNVVVSNVVQETRFGKPTKRKIGVIHVGKTWVNLSMVEKGFAWHYKTYSKDARLADAEDAARESKAGLWSDKSPTAPWEWRKQQKAAAKARREAAGK